MVFTVNRDSERKDIEVAEKRELIRIESAQFTSAVYQDVAQVRQFEISLRLNLIQV